MIEGMQKPVMVVDAFPEFLSFWEKSRHLPVEVQVERWQSHYMAQWPALLAKQLSQYELEKSDWQTMAAQRVFPFLEQRMPAICRAYDNLLAECERICFLANREFEFPTELTCIIYVGIGLGAGWATSLEGEPAILFGLENIAEEGWEDRLSIQKLVAHELGHLAHDHWREEGGIKFGTGPLWDLYSEGFAEAFSQEIVIDAVDSEWLIWCKAHKDWLAAEFLRRIDLGEDVRSFFGSWFEIEGRKQTGYCLGSELIHELASRLSMRDIAVMDTVEETVRGWLTNLAQKI